VYYAASTPFAPQAHVNSAQVNSAQVNSAPHAFAYQAAHALQDGLAGQVAGLPVAAIFLLRGTRRPDNRYQHQSANAHQTPKGGSNE
jgi:hypothetical protein